MEINFRHEINGQKVITAIAQDWKTGQILMVANMNKDALQKTIETGKAEGYFSCFFRKLNTKNIENFNEEDLETILEKVFNPDDVY